MKVRLIKVHPNWNTLYPETFKVGDVHTLENTTLITKSGLRFCAKELCKSFSNTCVFADIFEKI